MENKNLLEQLNEIEMPEEMQARILKKCYERMEDKRMNKNVKKRFDKPMLAVASLVLCVCVTGISALAATGKLKGVFKDIKNWNGAVIGTAYEQASDEIELEIGDMREGLEVLITMVEPEAIPYRHFETFGVESYQIVDMDGNVVEKGGRTEMSEVVNGKVKLVISLENTLTGEYKLIVSKMVGSAKAEQPLVISGDWECGFVR